MPAKPEIKTLYENARGCGFRQPGGLYLVCDGPGKRCSRLPLPLTVCPTCGERFKPSRGWTWIRPPALFANQPYCYKATNCLDCPAGQAIPDRAGLLWVGESFYSSPAIFDTEAEQRGISRRISAIPQRFQVGRDWVFLAHRKALCIFEGDWNDKPAIFSAFRPQRIEYVVKESDLENDFGLARLARLARRGVTLVRVIPKLFIQTSGPAAAGN